jgi:alpha-tubulin suppressor-like RCC1 family protein
MEGLNKLTVVSMLKKKDAPIRVDAGTTHAACITVENKLFVWGDNSSGQLGQSSERLARSPRPVQVMGLRSHRVRSVACGTFCTFAVTEGGELWAWGRGSDGQLGIGDQVTAAPEPTRVPHLGPEAGLPVEKIYAGRYTSAAIVSGSAEAFIWGSNQWGRLASGPAEVGREFVQWRPAHIKRLAGMRVQSIALGDIFSAFLVDPSFAAGAVEAELGVAAAQDRGMAEAVERAKASIVAESGALGGPVETNLSPVALAYQQSMSTLSKGSASIAAAVIAAESCRVLGGGCLMVAGALGMTQEEWGERNEAVTWPHYTDTFGSRREITQIAAGRGHLAILTRDGKVYMAGRGWLGNSAGNDANVHPEPVQALAGTHAVEVAAGSMHTAVRLADGRLVTFGANLTGSLGRQTFTDVPALQVHDAAFPVDAINPSIQALRVVCGADFTLVIAASPPPPPKQATSHLNTMNALATLQRSNSWLDSMPSITGGQVVSDPSALIFKQVQEEPPAYTTIGTDSSQSIMPEVHASSVAAEAESAAYGDLQEDTLVQDESNGADDASLAESASPGPCLPPPSGPAPEASSAVTGGARRSASLALEEEFFAAGMPVSSQQESSHPEQAHYEGVVDAPAVDYAAAEYTAAEYTAAETAPTEAYQEKTPYAAEQSVAEPEYVTPEHNAYEAVAETAADAPVYAAYEESEAQVEASAAEAAAEYYNPEAAATDAEPESAHAASATQRWGGSTYGASRRDHFAQKSPSARNVFGGVGADASTPTHEPLGLARMRARAAKEAGTTSSSPFFGGTMNESIRRLAVRRSPSPSAKKIITAPPCMLRLPPAWVRERTPAGVMTYMLVKTGQVTSSLWLQHVGTDLSAGQTSYVNATSGELVLERPEGDDAVVVQGVPWPLPAGWQEAADQASGLTYFFNAELNQSTWTRPLLHVSLS